MQTPMSQWLREIVGRPGWHCFVSVVGGETAGPGALFVEGEYAWLGIGATKPEARRRGAHSALLARRIEAARDYGARLAVTETGVPQMGEIAPSYTEHPRRRIRSRLCPPQLGAARMSAGTSAAVRLPSAAHTLSGIKT